MTDQTGRREEDAEDGSCHVGPAEERLLATDPRYRRNDH